MYYLGFDVGSISVNSVLLDENNNVIEEFYDYCQGKPFHTLIQRIQYFQSSGKSLDNSCAFTGTGGKLAANYLDGIFINEIVAQSKAASFFYPTAQTIIEMGGEDSKLITVENDGCGNGAKISDFTMNTLCAAGTGSFLDQQAKRIGVSIQGEFGELALKSRNPPRIAGRCSVFAKSDMIHLQQVATPIEDIIAGLCFAVARNFKSTLGKGKSIKLPVLFQGGVAANKGMIRAFKEVYQLKNQELIVPEYFASMGAIGAVIHAKENKLFKKQVSDPEKLKNYLASGREHRQILPKLIKREQNYNKKTFPLKGQRKVQAWLGIDVGSLSTNVAVIDKNNKVLARSYLPTESKPMEAIKKGLASVEKEIGQRVTISGVGTTGSGRYLTGDFVGADTIHNEITCQATAAIAIDPKVDTIFEIGGQDSKYIQIRDGVIVDFEMNKVCAAGTGSFLEEQADKLGINIIEEFGELGLSSDTPTQLGERCTVFMESDLNTHQQKGTSKKDLIAGLSYSIVKNYINRVVKEKPVGQRIFFQGGVTNNRAVLAAFEEITGKTIHVPPHFDITGAIGAAIKAREHMSNGNPSQFKGFEIGKAKHHTKNFICKSCSNHCEIKKVKIEGESRPFYYGGICERYELGEKKKKKKSIPNLFDIRTEMLLDGYEPDKNKGKVTIGIPRGLMNFYQFFPFWRTFLETLNFNVVLSDESDKQLVTESIETMVSETCLPVELMHGHVLNLVRKNVDFIFLPFIVNAKADKNNPTNNCNCPWIQAHPYMLKTAFTDKNIRDKLLIPELHFRYFDRVLKKELTDFFKSNFEISDSSVSKAIKLADDKQKEFEVKVKSIGNQYLTEQYKDVRKVVILGRAYNTSDTMLNLNVVKKLINEDVLPVPIDFLLLDSEYIFDEYPGMYWPNGQKILQAARIIAKSENLFGVYLSNFRCGPDSFLQHFVMKEMDGKPFLHLEIDEHSADAGMVTRIEAFLDSLKGWEKLNGKNRKSSKAENSTEIKEDLTGRAIYFPYAGDTVHALSAATRSCGIKSEVLPMQDQADVELGRKNMSGQECFPAICTTGSFLKKLQEPGLDPGKASFFMPDHNGPCRFGEYNKLQQVIFDKLGFREAKIVHPSNEDSYASIAPGYSLQWRKNAFRGIVAIDLLKKMVEQTRPYEIESGVSDIIYKNSLQNIIQAIENNCKNLNSELKIAARLFKAVKVKNPGSRPLVAIVGEVFMRDNPYCSNYLVSRLEKLGAETVMAPFAEWVNYSTLRYIRDSRWKGDIRKLMKARIQKFFQYAMQRRIQNSLKAEFELINEVRVEDMLENCGEYLSKHYDGDPPLAIGSAVLLAKSKISGVVNILPFTCMPGTINCTVSQNLRQDYGGLPWENFAYDGYENIGIDTRFEAFMYQVKGYHKKQKEQELIV